MPDPKPILRYDTPPVVAGPISIQSEMIVAATAAPLEGLWTPVLFCRNISIEVSVVALSSMSLQLWGTNVLSPSNQQIVTVGGSVSTSDVNRLTFSTPNLAAGSAQVSYTAIGGDGVNQVAAGLAAAINAAHATLGLLDVTAAAVGAAITVSWPTAVPPAANPQYSSPPSPGIGNMLTIAGSTTGSETFTVANGSNGQSIGAPITTAGFVQLNGVWRWIKPRLTSFTGTSVSVRLQGLG